MRTEWATLTIYRSTTATTCPTPTDIPTWPRSIRTILCPDITATPTSDLSALFQATPGSIDADLAKGSELRPALYLKLINIYINLSP